MEPSRRFEVGDRVRTVQPLVSLSAGSIGTIHRVYSTGNLYDVLFDGKVVQRVMHHDYLRMAELQERTVGGATFGMTATSPLEHRSSISYHEGHKDHEV